jgi:hypothetical protein
MRPCQQNHIFGYLAIWSFCRREALKGLCVDAFPEMSTVTESKVLEKLEDLATSGSRAYQLCYDAMQKTGLILRPYSALDSCCLLYTKADTGLILVAYCGFDFVSSSNSPHPDVRRT